MRVKSFFKAVYAFLSRPWVGIICGLILMIVPVCVAGPDADHLDPGFSYGVFYGAGLIISFDSIHSFFASNKQSAALNASFAEKDALESWIVTQCWINEKILGILIDQWSDVPPVADPPYDDPRF